MTDEAGSGYNRVGQLSVDVVGDISDVNDKLQKVEDALGKIPTEKSLALKITGLSEQQLSRLRTAAELIERIQATGVTNIPTAGGTAPAKGPSSAAPAVSGNVQISIDEAAIEKTFRAAAVSAFSQPIPVKFDVDMEHLQRQLAGIKVSFTGEHVGMAAAMPQSAPAVRDIPGLRQAVSGPGQREAIAEFVKAIKLGTGQDLTGSDIQQTFLNLADKFGDSINKAVKVQTDKAGDVAVSGGSIHRIIKEVAKKDPDAAQEIELRARVYRDQLKVTQAYDLYRRAGGMGANVVSPGTAPQRPPSTTTSQDQAATIHNLQAAEAQERIAKVQEQRQRQYTPLSADEIEQAIAKAMGMHLVETEPAQRNKAGEISKPAQYGYRYRGREAFPAGLTQPWVQSDEDILAGRPAPFEREFAAGRIQSNPRGLKALGAVGVRNVSLEDLVRAAGPGMREALGIQGLAEVYKGNRPTRSYIAMEPDVEGKYPIKPGERGTLGSYNVRGVSGADVLELLAARRVGGENIPQRREFRRFLGQIMNMKPAVTGRTANSSVLAMMSTGGAGVTQRGREEGEIAREVRRIEALAQKQLEAEHALAGTGVPTEQRALRAQISRRARRIQTHYGRFQELLGATSGISGAENRAAVERESTFEGPTTGQRIPIGDRSKLVEALSNLSTFGPETQEFFRGVEDIRSKMLMGAMPVSPTDEELFNNAALRKGESLGNMVGDYSTTRSGKQAIVQLVADVRNKLGLQPPSARSLGSTKKMAAAFTREGFESVGAAIDTIFGDYYNRRSMAERFANSYPEQTGDTEAGMSGQGSRQRHKGYVVPGEVWSKQTELDIAERDLAKLIGRGATVTDDPLAKTSAAERRRKRAQGTLTGPHPLRLAKIARPASEIGLIEERVRQQTAREMGFQLGNAPGNMGQILGLERGEGWQGQAKVDEFNRLVKEALESDPKYKELDAKAVALGETVTALRKEKKEWEKTARGPYRRREAPGPATPDEERRRLYDQGAAAPGGGLPVTEAERRGIPEESIGAPALQPGRMWTRKDQQRWTKAHREAKARGLSEQEAHDVANVAVPPPTVPPGGAAPPAGGGPGGTRPMEGGVIRVWIEGPFPLAVAMAGGMAGGVAAGKGRGRTKAAGAAAPAGAAAAEEVTGLALADIKAPKYGRVPTAVDIPARMRRAAQQGPTEASVAWLSSLSPESRQQVLAGIHMLPNLREAVTPQQRQAEQDQKTGQISSATFTRAANQLRGLGVDVATPGPQRLGAEVGGNDTDAAAVAAILRRQQGQLGQRAFGPTITSAVMNILAGGAIFQRDRTLAVPTELRGALGGQEELTLPGDPLSRINLARREQAEAQRLGRVAASSRVRLGRQQAEREEISRGLEVATARGVDPKKLAGVSKSLEEMDKAIEQSEQTVKSDTQAFENHAKAANWLAKSATTAGDVLVNLAQGFVGGIAAGIIAPLAPLVGRALIELIGPPLAEAMKPAYEAAIGYQNVVNKVIDSLSDETRARHGLADEAVALRAAQAGLTKSTYESIRPQLEQAASVEAGNKAYGDYIDVIRTGREMEGRGARGVYNTTGGVNIGGLQTPFFGVPSTLENFLNQFQGVAYKNPQQGLQFSYSPDALTDLMMKAGKGFQLFQEMPDFYGRFFNNGLNADYYKDLDKRLGLTGTDIKENAISDINDQLAKFGDVGDISARVRGGEVGGAGSQAFSAAARRAGAPVGTLTQIENLGLEFVDAQGKVITDLKQIDKILQQWASNLGRIDPDVWLETNTRALQAQIFQIERGGMRAREQTIQQFALGRIANPPVYANQILGGMPNAPEGFAAGFGTLESPYTHPMRAGREARSDTNAYQRSGVANIFSRISQIPDPTRQQAAKEAVQNLASLGAEAHRAALAIGQIQMGQQFRAWNREIFVTKRALGDVFGLNAKLSQDGVKATEFGRLEFAAQQLQHKMQVEALNHQQLTINYQRALAGFMAPGATGEEIAARQRIAVKETEYQQRVLNQNKTLTGYNWEMTQENNRRALVDTMYAYSELQRQINEAGQLIREQDNLTKAQEQAAVVSAIVASYVDEGNQMVAMTDQVAANVLALGYSSARAIDEATAAMVRAVAALRGAVSIWQRPGNKNTGYDNSGGYASGTLFQTTGATTMTVGEAGTETVAVLRNPRPMLMSGGGSQNGPIININNPAVSVDVHSLVRAVVSELSRQMSLRVGSNGLF